MPKLINLDGQVRDNPWLLVSKESSLDEVLALEDTQLLVPLALWLDDRQTLLAAGKQLGVWLDSDEQAASLAGTVTELELELVALHFPKFMDGRAYSTAVQLRRHLNYQGELRAIGEVLRDQLFYMRRCGFDSFDLADSVSLDDARSALADFRDNYQATTEQPLPLFRRRA